MNRSEAIAEELRARIARREWGPGDLIPTEVDLAFEFDCARATVSKALGILDADGLLERRRAVFWLET